MTLGNLRPVNAGPGATAVPPACDAATTTASSSTGTSKRRRRTEDGTSRCAGRADRAASDSVVAGNKRAQIQVQATGFGNGSVPVPPGKTISAGTV